MVTIRRSKSIRRSPATIGSSVARSPAQHLRSPQRRSDAAAELTDRERLGDVVVGAHLEAEHLVDLVVLGGEHDDRHLAAAAHAPADLDPVQLRQHDVEDDEIEPLLGEAVERLAAVVSRHDLVARPCGAGRRAGSAPNARRRRAGCEPIRRPRPFSKGSLRRALRDQLSHLPCRPLRRRSSQPSYCCSRCRGGPTPLPPAVASAEFDQDAAAKIDRQIVDAAPDRTPGSDGDRAIADMVEKRFTSVSEGQVAEQRFDGSFDDEDVQLRNLILTLPGESPRSVVVLAARDSASGPGAASSAAATAALLELVDKLRTARHTKTLVFVSTDGGSDGAAGAREFAEHFAQRNLIDGAVVLWQPGSATPRQPSLLDASDGSQSPSAQLVRTAEQALSEQTGRRPQLEGLFGELARLALPSGLGRAGRADRRTASTPWACPRRASGRCPWPTTSPMTSRPRPSGTWGEPRWSWWPRLDATAAPPEHGPAAYLSLAGSLVPGWALALLALTLVLPAALASLDSLRRAFRRRARVGWALAWSASRGLPLACRRAAPLPAGRDRDRRPAAPSPSIPAAFGSEPDRSWRWPSWPS